MYSCCTQYVQLLLALQLSSRRKLLAQVQLQQSRTWLVPHVVQADGSTVFGVAVD